MKNLLIVLVGSALACGAIYVARGSVDGSAFRSDSLGETEVSEEGSQGELLAKTLAGTGVMTRINTMRREEEMDALQWGVGLERQLAGYPELASPDLNALLGHLQAGDRGAASASVWHLTSDTAEGLARRVEMWDRLMDPEMTHFAIHTKELPGGQFACVAALIRRVSEFSLSELHREPAEYVRSCPLCDHTHSIRFEDPNSTVVIACPDCDQEYDMIAFGSDGRYRRANGFLTGFSPPAAYRPGAPDVALMVSIWKEVLGHCRYRNDRFSGVKGDSEEAEESEIWRFAHETYRARHGDCEDTSILLADWLGSRGFEVRVAVGENRVVGPHAWVVVKIDGKQYLLETTNARPDMENLPVVDGLSDEYLPHQLFDAERIYFRRDRSSEVSATDYWGEDMWVPIRYSQEDVTAGPGAISPDALVPELGLGWGGSGS